MAGSGLVLRDSPPIAMASLLDPLHHPSRPSKEVNVPPWVWLTCT